MRSRGKPQMEPMIGDELNSLHSYRSDYGRSPCRHREETLRRSDLVGLTGRTISILAFLVIAFTAAAQTSGKLRLQIDPANGFSYKLDHRFTLQQTELELLEGAHHFSFWAPQRKVVDTTITVTGGATNTFELRLPYSTEYLVYQRNMRAYEGQMHTMRLLPAAITGASLIFTGVKYADMKKAHDRLDADADAYDNATSPHAIITLKENVIPAHSDEFDKARTSFRISAGVTVLFAGVTTWLYLRSAKIAKPEFHDAEKVRFDGLSWMPGPNGGAWTGGLTWNFTR